MLKISSLNVYKHITLKNIKTKNSKLTNNLGNFIEPFEQNNNEILSL